MSWMLIALLLLVAFGPVLWLVPSKRDRRLTALRARARAEGMLVEIRRLPNPDPTPQQRVSSGGKVRDPVIETASYGYPMKRKLEHLPTWRVVRRADQEAQDPLPGWSYDLRPKGEGRDYLSPMLDLTEPLLAGLPQDVVAFEVERRILLVYWLEKPGSSVESVGEMAASLGAFEASLVALEDEISAKIDNDDS